MMRPKFTSRFRICCLLLLLVIAACKKENVTTAQAIDEPVGVAYKDSLDDVFLAPESQQVVFTNVHVVSMTSEGPLMNRDVFVSDGRIKDVVDHETLPYPSSHLIVEAENQYLMPGLADMHIHPISSDNLVYDLFLFLAKGITTVRVMWGFDSHIAWRDRIRNGEILGPDMYVASAGFDGLNTTWPGSVNTTSDDEVRQKVDEFASKGYDFIKVYSGISASQYEVLVDHASEKGIRPIGHVPSGVDASQAISRLSSISHLGKFRSSSMNPTQLYASLANSSTMVCPTMTVINRFRSELASYQGDWYQLVSPEARSFHVQTQNGLLSTDAFANTMNEVLVDIHDAGGKILAGTDTGIRFVLPGTSLHEELRYYVNAGMSPLEILESAITNPSSFIDRDDLGTIEVGQIADLVLLSANPLEDIQHTEKISGVMKGGVWLSRDQIDQTLEWIRNYYHGD